MHHLPSLFVSHGAPTFALEPGSAGRGLSALGATLPRPKAVLVVSPHWMTPNLRVSCATQPATIHDFGGFAPALYRISYPAPGQPAVAQRALDLLRAAGWTAEADGDQGRDHGAWVPLLHLYPKADVPVLQVSLPQRLDGAAALALGEALAPLASEGVLIMGSGSLTHNLYEFRGYHGDDEPYVREFARWVHDALQQGDRARLARTLQEAPHARRAHPTPEHFWPLLVACGAASRSPAVQVIDGGIAYGVLSMDAFVFSAKEAS